MKPWMAAAVVVVHAAAQTLLVLADPVPSTSWPFVLATIASAAALLMAVWFLTNLALRAVPWQRPVVLGWAALLAVVAIGLSLLSPVLVPLVLVVAGPMLPAAATGGVSGALRVFRRAPVRSVLLLVGSVVLAVLSWAGALPAGLFVGGPVGAFVTWLWFGAVTAFLLWQWAAMSGYRGKNRAAATSSVGAVENSQRPVG